MATNIQITFSSAPDPSTVNSNTIRVTAPGPVTGSLALGAGSDTVTFTPFSGLEANSTYTVTVSGVVSSTGVAMAGTFTSDFGTVTTAPVSTAIGPCLQYLMGSPFQCTEFLAPLHPVDRSGVSSPESSGVSGQIAVDSSGDVSVVFSPVTANTAYTVQFCPAYNAKNPAGAPPCFDVGTISSDISGFVNTTVQFPRSGSWAGDFQIVSGSTVLCRTTWPTGSSQDWSMVHGDFMAFMMQPETTVNGTGVTVGSKIQDPLAGGDVVFSSGVADFELDGAEPNTAYNTYESVTRAVDGSSTYKLSTFTTDSNGNWEPLPLSADPYLSGYGGDIFLVEPQDQSHAGWIGGFSVP